MTQNRANTILTVCTLVGIVTLSFGCSKAPTKPTTLSFDDAKAQALEVIAAREEWPATPEDVCKAFWDARAKKDYKEMEILWPGSASYDWPSMCKDDPDVTYVFGAASDDLTEVPYATADYHREHGTYNLKIRIEAFDTPKGTRDFIVSGN